MTRRLARTARRCRAASASGVSIARAIVRQAPILLLDEATSALDNEAEARVQQALIQVMEGRTTIVIAHRTVDGGQCRPIIVMEQGRLVEEGTMPR